MKFESLGAPVWGCEFGFVQQKFGAEPISLLRWASINTLRLIEALEHRFEGTGDSGQTTLHRPVNMQRDYHTRDTRFWIETHTFMFLGDVSEEKLLQQYCATSLGGGRLHLEMYFRRAYVLPVSFAPVSRPPSRA